MFSHDRARYEKPIIKIAAVMASFFFNSAIPVPSQYGILLLTLKSLKLKTFRIRRHKMSSLILFKCRFLKMIRNKLVFLAASVVFFVITLKPQTDTEQMLLSVSATQLEKAESLFPSVFLSRSILSSISPRFFCASR